MRCLSADECTEHLRLAGVHFEDGRYAGFLRDNRRLPPPQRAHWPDGVLPAGIQATLPTASDQQSRLISALFDLAPPDSGWLLWLLDWGIWSGGFEDLIYLLRRCAGESRLFFDTPGHLFAPQEAPLAKSIARLGLAVGWDAHLVNLPASLVAFMSHDDYLELYAPDEPAMRALERAVAPAGVVRWK